MNQHDLRSIVEKAVREAPVYDIHTHLYAPAFGELLLYGIDEMLTYHYLVAEAFRYLDLPYEKFWTLSKTELADLIWNALFLEHTPLSEACRGILTTLNRLGLDVSQRDLPALRRYFAEQQPNEYVDKCMELAGVKKICMTNSPFEAEELAVWERGYRADERFSCGLRIDPLLMQTSQAFVEMRKQGYEVSDDLSGKTIDEVRRFLADWTRKMNALYVMVSLPPEWAYPDDSLCSQLIEQAVLPHCREFNMAFALMIGVTRQVNPGLKLAGDGMGRADLTALRNLCAAYPQNKFLVTVLARENHHELCVLARKFRNLHVFGCWWFVNVPSLIEEITKMRLELIGPNFSAQHSDARVMDQIVYKWDHSRAVVGDALASQYEKLAASGWTPSEAEIRRDVNDLLGGAFEKFLQKTL